MNSQGEFVVDTMEHCFLCSSAVLHPHKQESIYSIECLSRYLKMDIGKVFHDKGTVPLHLLDQVQKSRLKVKLCENCVYLIQKFSKLYHQLEKIEMEVGCCIKLIHEKLASAENSPNHHFQNMSSTYQSVTNELTGKLEIANVLRKEAMEKCSFRVNSVTPQVKIQNLTFAQANAKMKKFRHRKTRRNVSKSSFKNFESSEPEMGYVKLENDELDMMSEDANEDCYINDDHPSDSPGEELSLSRLPNLFDEVKNEETESLVDDAALELAGNGSRLPYPASQSQPPKSTFNPKTGKYKCSKCAKEFTQKYYVRHHIQSVHMGVVRFNCKTCNRGFYKKGNLKQHLRLTTCGKGQPPKPIKITCSCNLCGKGYSRKAHLKTHYDTVHRKLRRHACDLCETTFARKGDLERHRRTIHFGIKGKRTVSTELE